MQSIDKFRKATHEKPWCEQCSPTRSPSTDYRCFNYRGCTVSPADADAKMKKVTELGIYEPQQRAHV